MQITLKNPCGRCQPYFSNKGTHGSKIILVGKWYYCVWWSTCCYNFQWMKLNKLLCGFRKGNSTQHALIWLVQKWQSCLDNNEVAGTVLMDLSKAYDCLNYELLIVSKCYMRMVSVSKVHVSCTTILNSESRELKLDQIPMSY